MHVQAHNHLIAVVVEDDADVRNLLSAILTEAGFACVTAATGVEEINAIREHQPLLTTLDISLPGIDGFEVARRIRTFSDTYVIMVSARDEEIDTLMGLDAGADDYLTKPFRPRELRARIEAMLRRHRRESTMRPEDVGAAHQLTTPTFAPRAIGEPADENQGWHRHRGLRINADLWLCDLDGASVALTRSEFDLLFALMTSRGQVVTKNALAQELRGEAPGGYASPSDRRAVEVHMAKLRRKLNDSVSTPRFIATVRGVGYRLTGTTRSQLQLCSRLGPSSTGSDSDVRLMRPRRVGRREWQVHGDCPCCRSPGWTDRSGLRLLVDYRAYLVPRLGAARRRTARKPAEFAGPLRGLRCRCRG